MKIPPNNISGVHVDDGTNCLAILCTDANNNGIADECEDLIWTVDDDGPADFDNIQSAIDASSDGYEIIVMPGTYTSTEDEVVDMLGKNVWLHSSDGAEVTIIDGAGIRRGILSQQATMKTIIDGFTISNCYGLGSSGMYNITSFPTVQNCIFENNNGYNSGGMYNYYSSPTLTNCTFTGKHCSLRRRNVQLWKRPPH